MGIIGWLKGYLVISVKGNFPERFVNLCAVKGIKLSGVTKKEEAFILKTSVKSFRGMRKICRITKCRVHILKKAGLPFRLARWGKRKVFLMGAAVFLALIAFSNSFVWTIRIDGNKILTEDEIKIIADYCGLRQGVVKYKLDQNKFSKNALRCEPRLAWIWPEIKGTVCYIHVREKTLAEPPVNPKEPADVIAKRDGIITSLIVKRGWPLVSEGDSVVAGQVLVSSECEGFKPVHASGEVIASYWVEKTAEVKTVKNITQYTGKEKSYYSLIIGSFGMSFRFLGNAPYESFEYSEEENYLKLFGEIMLPVRIKKQSYKEVECSEIKISVEQAIDEAVSEVTENFKSTLAENVSVKNITVKKDGITEDGATLKVLFECSEDIALTSRK